MLAPSGQLTCQVVLKKNYILRVSNIDSTQNHVTAYLDIRDNDQQILMKIEELTLYVNDLKKENENIKRQIDELKK